MGESWQARWMAARVTRAVAARTSISASANFLLTQLSTSSSVGAMPWANCSTLRSSWRRGGIRCCWGIQRLRKLQTQHHETPKIQDASSREALRFTTMKTPSFNTTLLFYPNKNPKLRLFALWYFAILMIVWNILGHTYLGFEQPWAAPFVGVGTAIAIQLLLEWVDATAKNREPRFAGGLSNFLNSLPAALIPGFACAMLLYPNERLWPIVFAVVLSISSKVLIRAPVGGGRTQHVFNPSNFGVAATLVLFPQVGFAPPYHFTENITGVWDWILPGIILLSGVIVHGFFTGRLPLVLAWLAGF